MRTMQIFDMIKFLRLRFRINQWLLHACMHHLIYRNAQAEAIYMTKLSSHEMMEELVKPFHMDFQILI